MQEALNQLVLYTPEFLSFLGGATVGSIITFKFTKNKASFGGRIIDQSCAQAGKDIVGGNKTKILRKITDKLK